MSLLNVQGAVTWHSVSYATARVLPALLGVEWPAGTGIVVGEVYGCDGLPVANVQVILFDEACARGGEGQTWYARNNLPSPTATATDDDGEFYVIGLTPGDWFVEAWGADGGAARVLARAPLRVERDAFHGLSLYVGVADGAWMPDTCL